MKKKTLLVSLMCFIMLFVITGCGKKTAIDSATFKSKAEENGYSITEITNQYSNIGYIKAAYVALSTDGYQIEYYKLDSVDNAKKMYETNKDLLANLGGSNKVETRVNLANYSKYSVSTDSYYGYVSRIDDTIIYVNESSTHKDKIQDFVKKLGY